MRICLAVLAAIGLALAAPVQAEVTAQSGAGFAVQQSVAVAVDPETAFAMLRTPAKWWDKAHSWTGNADNLYMDAQAGGCFCELIPNAATTDSGAPQRTLRGSVQHMQIVYVDPGRMLRMSGALGPLQGEAMAGTMTVKLVAIKGGTRVTFDYLVGGFMRMDPEEVAPMVDAMIGAQASRLAMALGPLVGAADAQPAASNSVKRLVTGLAPDAGSDAGPVADPSAAASTKAPTVTPSAASGPSPTSATPATAPTAPPARKRYKPGTRPLSRPGAGGDRDDSAG